MSKSLSIICTVILSAAACDEAETLAEEVDAQDADAEARDGELVVNIHTEALGTCATLFEHSNYGGDRREVNRGAHVPWIGGPWNDQVSSMRVRPGCVLNAYQHADFGGAHETFAGQVPWVGDAWNDIISSYTCTCSQ